MDYFYKKLNLNKCYGFNLKYVQILEVKFPYKYAIILKIVSNTVQDTQRLCCFTALILYIIESFLKLAGKS